jgi:L-2,4-diaminobutyric acid acetyltransferase
MLGFVIAYRPPDRNDVIFVWQIGTAVQARRRGLARRLLHELVSLPACQEVEFLEATVSQSNRASRRLFESFAQDRGVPCRVAQGFTAEMFGNGVHEPEELFRIGPLRP